MRQKWYKIIIFLLEPDKDLVLELRGVKKHLKEVSEAMVCFYRYG
jgi:hypothetical protein